MFTVSYVNFIQVGLIATALIGLVLLWHEKHYRQIAVLLVIVILAGIFNLLEELNVTRDLHLVTPVFILGFGPATYLAIKGLLGHRVTALHYLHLAPMLMALPFTRFTAEVIFIGTLWRFIYALLVLHLLYRFTRGVVTWRSDAGELSFKWLSGWVVLMTLVSILNLGRLNFQVELGHALNVLGQGISTAVSLVFFIVLLYQLIHNKGALLALITDVQAHDSISDDDDVQTAPGSSPQDAAAAEYEAIYQHLVEQIEEHQWYTIPRLTLHQLSEYTGIQTRDISRAINLHAEGNFNDFINQYRLQYVIARMRSEPGTPLLTLATDAGFNAKSTFNLAFKRAHAMTPAQYRERLNSVR